MKLDKIIVYDIIGWDVNNWSKSLDIWRPFLDEVEKSVLVVGNREGRLSLWFALYGHKVFCSDKHGTVDSAKKLHKFYSVDDKIKYINADIMQLNFNNNQFDIIAFKSVLGALKNEININKAILEMYRVLRPGGKLFVAENAEGSAIHSHFRERFNKYSWKYLNINELGKIFKPFNIIVSMQYGFFSAFGFNESIRNCFSYIDKLFNKIIPNRFKYIHFLVLQKD